MDPTSAIPAILAVSTAMLTTHIIKCIFGSPKSSGRFISIDGLRGFLAFFVFLHHACIWYFYLRSGRWETPPSRLYTHFGQSAVSLFFMITAFLFSKKIIDTKEGEIDWLKLYVSRILRLSPLYFVAIAILFLLVLIVSNWELNESIPRLGLGFLRWLIFTIFGAPNLNGITDTFTIIAGVTWSLPYEWAFYFFLPIFALICSKRNPRIYLALGIASILFIIRHPDIRYLSFLGGIIAAICQKSEIIIKLAPQKTSSMICLTCIIIVVLGFPEGNGPVQLILLTVFFTLIASGTNLFGILSNSTSRLLGEFAYGIYLIHGLMLFIVFNKKTGLSSADLLTPMQHWLITIALTPAIILISFLSYKFIELPAMQQSEKLTKSIRSILFKKQKKFNCRNHALSSDNQLPRKYISMHIKIFIVLSRIVKKIPPASEYLSIGTSHVVQHEFLETASN